MPDNKSKTIEIDEILPAGRGEDVKPARAASRAASPKPPPSSSSGNTAAPPFPDLSSSLGWKARVTLQLTQWFLILRSKSWGKWIIVPLVVLLIILAIPVILLGIIVLMLASTLKSLTRK